MLYTVKKIRRMEQLHVDDLGKKEKQTKYIAVCKQYTLIYYRFCIWSRYNMANSHTTLGAINYNYITLLEVLSMKIQ